MIYRKSDLLSIRVACGSAGEQQRLGGETGFNIMNGFFIAERLFLFWRLACLI